MTRPVKIEGVQETLAALDKFGADAMEYFGDAVEAMGQKARRDAIHSVQRDPKTGRVYQRGKGQNLSSTHQASAPGQAPATDTGRLASSIKFVRSNVRGLLFSRVVYASWLEYGTTNIEERPFMNPAVDKNQEYFLKQLRKAADKASGEFNR